MKSIAPFFTAGIATVFLFSVPGADQLAFLFAWIGFGPALVFAATLLFAARILQPKPSILAVVFACLLGYWCGEVFYLRLQAPLRLGFAVNFVAPAVGAFSFLLCLAVTSWSFRRIRVWFRPFMLGTVCSSLSGIPLWLVHRVHAPNYPSWGVHILFWYLSVGPFALAILRGVDPEKKEEPNQPPEPTTTAGTSAAEPPRVPAAVVAHL